MDKIKSPLTNIMEIMNIVIKRIESGGQKDSHDKHIVTQLLEKGFSMDDIDMAMGIVAMITSKVNPIVKVNNREKGSDGKFSGVRQLNAKEAIRLTPDAQRYLLSGLEDGSITSLQYERTLLYLQQMDLRGVNKTKLEIILTMNKTVDIAESKDFESSDDYYYSTIH